MAPQTTVLQTTVQQLARQHPRLWVPRGSPGQPLAPTPHQEPRRWSFTGLAGRLVEVAGAEASAVQTVAVRLVAEAQQAGDLAAWVGAVGSGFYPPDVAAHGVDLARLALVRVPEAGRVALAAARLTHSGAFGLVVLDLTAPSPARSGGSGGGAASGAASGGAFGGAPRRAVSAGVPGGVSDAHLGRLVQHAQRHDILVLCLTRKGGQVPSLGSLVAVRAQAERQRTAPGRFTCAVSVLKDKRHGAGWRHEEVVHGAPGLR